jgi:hypothetical protein
MARTQNQSATPGPRTQKSSTGAASRGPRQEVEGSNFKEDVTQKSDQPQTQQRVASSSGRNLFQTITGKTTELRAFGVRGQGKLAVVIAGVIVLAFLAFKYLH